MTASITRSRLTAVAATAAIAAVGVTAGPANAAHSRSKAQKAKKSTRAAASSSAAAQSIKGNMTAGGIKVTFDAKRAAGSKTATGSFVAEGAPVAAMGLPSSVGSIRLAGPITCLETRGQDASFYYEFDKTSTSGLLGGLGAGMIVSLRKDDASTYKMGFTPMLSSFVPMVGCDSSVAPLFVTSGGWQTGS